MKGGGIFAEIQDQLAAGIEGYQGLVGGEVVEKEVVKGAADEEEAEIEDHEEKALDFD